MSKKHLLVLKAVEDLNFKDVAPTIQELKEYMGETSNYVYRVAMSLVGQERLCKTLDRRYYHPLYAEKFDQRPIVLFPFSTKELEQAANNRHIVFAILDKRMRGNIGEGIAQHGYGDELELAIETYLILCLKEGRQIPTLTLSEPIGYDKDQTTKEFISKYIKDSK